MKKLVSDELWAVVEPLGCRSRLRGRHLAMRSAGILLHAELGRELRQHVASGGLRRA
jgi:hypothetical protein